MMRLLRKNYPIIFDELTQQPALTDLQRIGDLLTKFCEVKGINCADVIKNKDQSRMIFIAVVAKAYDPMFFVDEDKFIMYKLPVTLSEKLLVSRSQISHILSTVRTYLKVYKPFREEVSQIYALIIHSVHENKN